MQEIAVGGAQGVPRAYGDSAAAVLAIVHRPLPPMVCLLVLGGRFVRPMSCEAAAPARKSRIGRLIGHFAPSASVAGDDRRHAMVAFGCGSKLGVMKCRAC